MPSSKHLKDVETKCLATPISFIKQTFHSPKIKQCKNEPYLYDLINAIVTKVQILGGFKGAVTPSDAEDILNLIHMRFNNLSVDEVYKAFELERFGMYESRTEHYQLFNSQYVSDILSKYLLWKSNIRQEHKLDPDTSLLENETKLSNHQKKEIVVRGIINEFENYTKTLILSDAVGYMFDFLLQHGIIKKNEGPYIKYYTSQYALAMKQVESKAREQISNPQTPIGLRNQLRKTIECIKEKDNIPVIVRLKELVLMDLFKSKGKTTKESKNFITQLKQL